MKRRRHQRDPFESEDDDNDSTFKSVMSELEKSFQALSIKSSFKSRATKTRSLSADSYKQSKKTSKSTNVWTNFKSRLWKQRQARGSSDVFTFTGFQQRYKTILLRDSKTVTGNRIILPESVIKQIHFNDNDVCIFQLSFPFDGQNRQTHCGVMEFTAEENKVLVPGYIMNFMKMKEFQTITVKRARLPRGKFARFKPLDSDFFLIPKRRDFLERVLRDYVALTEGDIVQVEYRDQMYNLIVTKLEPGNAIQIVNCDLEVDFEEADEKIESDYYSKKSALAAKPSANLLFSGHGNSLCNLSQASHESSFSIKSSNTDKTPLKEAIAQHKSDHLFNKEHFSSIKIHSDSVNVPQKKALPDFEWRLGDLHFRRDFEDTSKNLSKE